MENKHKSKYDELSDKELVEEIVTEPHDEEAAVHLLYERYRNALVAVYVNIVKPMTWFEDCVNDLYLLLKGDDLHWRPLASFEWRSSFGTWIKKIASREFPKTIKKMRGMIEHGPTLVSIDSEDDTKPQVILPDGGEEDYERRLRKVMLMEAIGKLEDDDQRFVILKRLEGYDSNEIATLLQVKWQMLGIKKYNKRKELIVPDAGYINVRTQRAKANLRKLLVEL